MLHLFHPALVHLSVAFLIAGGVSEAWGILARRRGPERFGAVLVLAGTVSLLPTVVTGSLAANTVDLPPGAKDSLVLHERIGFVILGVFLVSQFWKAWDRGRVPDGQKRAYALFLLAGVMLVVFGAYLGGEMVYGYGVGVFER